MIVKKITVGFVTQAFDTDTGKFIDQDFTAGDQVDWEDEYGNTVDLAEKSYTMYYPFHMVQ